MWVRFQGSALRTALSITTAACSFVLTAARCPAGEKIDFSTPSNPALAQLPAAVVREDDDTDSLLKMPGNGNGMQGRRYVVPPVTTTTIMVAPRDRRKTDDLRAWDSVLTPPTLADQDEAFNANLKPKPANPFTNSYDATSQWDLTPSTLKQTQTLGLSTLSPMDDSARHGWNAHNWESHGNDLSPFKEFSHEDQSADSVIRPLGPAPLSPRSWVTRSACTTPPPISRTMRPRYLTHQPRASIPQEIHTPSPQRLESATAPRPCSMDHPTAL